MIIYLLAGLLVIHGIVCLLGAFFPFYPPVFLFYAFFPGHFAIRLIIILITGAAQIAYGLHLILRKRWRIRWYWPALATIVITGLLLVYPAVQDPSLFAGLTGRNENYQPIPVKEMPPPQLPIQVGGKPDDIIPVPGGLAYRANSHEEGIENPCPPIDTSKVVISSSFKVDMVYIRYRDYIETKAGESRNNIVSVSMSNRAVGSPNLYTVNLPAGIEVTEGMRLHRPGPVAVVLVMDVSPDVQPGQYNFDIGIEIDGKDYGTVPCTIKVTSETTPTSAPQPIPQQPAELLLRIISVTSPVRPLANVTLVAETLPEAECYITIDYGPSGVQSLHPKIADGSGKVSWTWTVGNFRGEWEIVVKANYGGETAYRSIFFMVQ